MARERSRAKTAKRIQLQQHLKQFYSANVYVIAERVVPLPNCPPSLPFWFRRLVFLYTVP